jgi:uncharacterized Ntn-hydrolase superfamily protein
MHNSDSRNSTRINKFPFAHTYSIVAYDPETGDMGAAVQSHWFSVGSLVSWAEAGVGVIATQAIVNVSYGPNGLQLMGEGYSAQETLEKLLKQDPQSSVRQVAMIDAAGNVAAHTGSKCIAQAGYHTGKNYSVQANMMLNDSIWGAMSEAYENSTGLLAERMLAALEAAQAAGGDVRGQQSAAILVVSGKKYERPWEGIQMDLRVEDHPMPIQELKRLVRLQQAYSLMNAADNQIAKGNFSAATISYEQATEYAPEVIEISFWRAVALAEIGRLDEAMPLFNDVFAKNPQWGELLQRLPDADLFTDNPAIMKKILNLLTK